MVHQKKVNALCREIASLKALNSLKYCIHNNSISWNIIRHPSRQDQMSKSTEKKRHSGGEKKGPIGKIFISVTRHGLLNCYD